MSQHAPDRIQADRAAPYNLYVVGLGIVSVRQITREAESALRRSTEILYASDAIGIADYLGDPPVSFAVAGHPMVFVYPTQQILKIAALLGLRVAVLPGISSLDCMIIDLGLDPGSQGIQMYETTALLLHRRELQPDVPCFLWQVGSAETRLFTRSRSVPQRFNRLQQHLLKYYPAGHIVRVVHSATHSLARSSILEFPIERMHEHAAEIHPGATLYIPPSRPAEIKDTELRELVDSAEHLKTITNAR